MKQKVQNWIDGVLFEYLVPTGIQRRLSRRAILYTLYGVFNTVLDLGVFYVATEWVRMGYILSATLSFLAAATSGFILNKYFNYRDASSQVAFQYGVYCAVSFFGLLITYLFLYFFIDILGLHRMVAKAVTSLVLAVYGYFAHTHITFRPRRTTP